ncbi:MAG: hypothetical protein KDE68_02230 [Rhodocyclaceae bacterium]|nr:hypothetical protein [Rhodocyclaceae bacterium]
MKQHPAAPPAQQPGTVVVDGDRIEVWPVGQRLGQLGEPTVKFTEFPDTDRYHPQLLAKMLSLEAEGRLTERLFKGGCGTKLRGLPEWRSPAARLINARAHRLCREVLQTEEIHLDDAWGNVYRHGDYCMPHSHLRSVASVVYFLSLGEAVPNDPLAGSFCIGDPRAQVCCPIEGDRMTHAITPEPCAGTMIIFPSQLVHYVNPYPGNEPRITLSWNFTRTRLSGHARDDWQRA